MSNEKTLDSVYETYDRLTKKVKEFKSLPQQSHEIAEHLVMKKVTEVGLIPIFYGWELYFDTIENSLPYHKIDKFVWQSMKEHCHNICVAINDECAQDLYLVFRNNAIERQRCLTIALLQAPLNIQTVFTLLAETLLNTKEYFTVECIEVCITKIEEILRLYNSLYVTLILQE